MENRIAAILVGLAITFALEKWAGLQWYFALGLGVLGYACVRYVGHVVRGRRYLREMTEEAPRQRDKISN
jgi:hypothetical protein